MNDHGGHGRPDLDLMALADAKQAARERVRNRMEDAGKLFIPPRTAESHVASLRNKLGVSTRAEVAAWVADNMHTAEPR